MQLRRHGAAGLTAVLCLMMIVSSVSARQWSPQSYPNPELDVNSCGRDGKPSWICDPDQILSEYSQNTVEGSILEIAAAKAPYRPAHCPDLPPQAAGYQVRAVVILSRRREDSYVHCI